MIAEENLKCSELLNLVIDGQATKEQEVSLMEHVHNCKKCKDELEIMTSIKSNLKSTLQKIATPKDLSTSIQTKIFEIAS